MFDGVSLDGWIQRGDTATYEIRKGALVGHSQLADSNSFLCTKEDYGDFELRFEVKCGEVNSGVQIRSLASKGGESLVGGPQVEIEQGPGQAGYIYHEALGDWVSAEPKSNNPAVSQHQHFMNDKWNEYRIVAVGPRIQTTLNGQIISDITDDKLYESYPMGFIGLQVFNDSSSGDEVEWRNIRIREY